MAIYISPLSPLILQGQEIRRHTMNRPLFEVMLTFFLISCVPDSAVEVTPDTPECSTLEAPLEGYCENNVIGTAIIDMETDYPPHVVSCGNGTAPLEAFKAKTVAVRPYAYFKNGLSNSMRLEG